MRARASPVVTDGQFTMAARFARFPDSIDATCCDLQSCSKDGGRISCDVVSVTTLSLRGDVTVLQPGTYRVGSSFCGRETVPKPVQAPGEVDRFERTKELELELEHAEPRPRHCHVREKAVRGLVTHNNTRRE